METVIPCIPEGKKKLLVHFKGSYILGVCAVGSRKSTLQELRNPLETDLSAMFGLPPIDFNDFKLYIKV